MKCDKCNKDNRAEARYCKWCGERLVTASAADPLSHLVEKDEVVEEIRRIVTRAKSKGEFNRSKGLNERMQLSFVITGDAGSGKTETALALTKMLHQAGVVKSDRPEVVNPIDFKEWMKDIAKHETKIGNNVVIFEEAQKLIGKGDDTQVNEIDRILQLAKKWRERGDMPVVILTGNRNLRSYFDNNKSASANINYFFDIDNLSVDGLLEVAEHILEKKYGRTLTKEARDKLHRIFLNDFRNPDDALGSGGHNAATRAYNIDLAAIDRGTASATVTEEMVNGKEFKPKTIEDVLKEFDAYVGVDNIKKEVIAVADDIRQMVAAGRPPEWKRHYRFVGNPGTGKTTMARIFADALNALGALPVGQLVEVGKDDLVSQFVGESSKLVTAVFKRAMGGVLFIDEAYQLANDSHGKDALDTILALAENNRGKLVVIIAGYEKEIDDLNKLNKGLKSRFKSTVLFPDYDADALTEIFRRMVEKSPDGLRLSEDAEEGVLNFFKQMYLGRGSDFGNARDVRNAFETARDRMMERLREDPSLPREITMADIEGKKKKGQTLEDILKSLDELVGMEKVKEQLASIARNVMISRMQMEAGGGDPELFNVHVVITGNPGTGKNAVAQRLGKIFKAIGVLAKGHTVVRERKNLLDSYANSAAKNMDQAVDEAMGGVLFIDEAYNLMPTHTPGSKDADGAAAVEALMTRMQNDAGKFVTVIAGYKMQIDEFLANANDGLESRFTHRIHIDDYTPPQLTEIFIREADKRKLKLSDEAKALLEKKIEEMVTVKDSKFANARTIIKLFSQTRERMGTRLDKLMEKGELSPDDKDKLFTIEAPDIPYEPPRKVDIEECMRRLDELVGLEEVKREVRNLADTLMIEQERAALSGEQPKIHLDHYKFVGNPGTGKTTVARIMGEIFYSLGVLPSNKLVEVTPGDMVAPFVGQTGAKTRQIVERSIGGVLFIDEAYGLRDGNFGEKDAIPMLLTELLDKQGKMVCIVAGYPKEINWMMGANTGLPRRFRKEIHFADYGPEDLATIFRNIVKKNGMRLDDGADEEMQRYFKILVLNKGADFGNASEAGAYFNMVKVNQGARLRKEKREGRQLTTDDLYVLKYDDMIIRQ